MRTSIARFLSGVLDAGIIHIQAFLAAYGLFAFIGMSMLKGLLLFVVIPAEAVTPTYVLLVADSPIDVIGIALVAAAAILAGNTVIYLLSRRLGETFVLYKKFRGTKQWRVMKWVFDRHGRASMFTLRLVPMIGGWATIPAGIVRFTFRDFLIFSFLGFFLYELTLGFAAYYGIKMGLIVQYETLAPLIKFLQSLV